MPQPKGITIELECDTCSADLTGEIESVRGRTVIRIKPCPTCLADAKNPPEDVEDAEDFDDYITDPE